MLPALQSIDSLAVRCPNWVGDIVMATPVFECLRNNFPTATITALVRPYARGILEDAPWFDANGLNDIAPMEAKSVLEKLQEQE